ncbi:FAD-dependent oxidoreductase [Xinfangfangia sp. D13-10-4-6]|uniref:FAD-dependent oxidoreductase n=1 Tax=Pseudogemmobacter hezensis TaxID=2737662 RepID=UPI0015553092|nr:FAD-dependent oxidoreductase [Pseudogemmobacter hezensis]NPD16891.1 FAD-dependent oxidoreductase [Pseudogemmobacter hezensis]
MGQIHILGAGVMGLVMATELAARGHQISISDPAGGPGPGACSWWAGGMLAPECEAESAEEPVARLGAEAAAWWQKHSGCVSYQGTLVLADPRDRADLSRFARLTKGHQTLDEAGISALEPDLAGRFRQGLFFADEAHLAPRAALKALVAGLAARGITITAAPPAKPALTTALTPTLTIDCRGLAARDQLTDLRGVRGEMLLIRCEGVTLSRPVRLLHPRIPLYIVPRGDGVFMLGATMIESDLRGAITLRSMMELMAAAWAIHPGFGEAALIATGADARPAFPDNLPRLIRRGDVLFANGLYRHGFLLSPATARMAAEHIETGAQPEFLHEVSP